MTNKNTYLQNQRVFAIMTSSLEKIYELFPYPNTIIYAIKGESRKGGKSDDIKSDYGVSGYNIDTLSCRNLNYHIGMNGYQPTNPLDKFGEERQMQALDPITDVSIDEIIIILPLKTLDVKPESLGFNSANLKTEDKWIVLRFISKKVEKRLEEIWQSLPINKRNVNENNWTQFRCLYLVDVQSYDDWKWQEDDSKKIKPIIWTSDNTVNPQRKTSPISIVMALRGVLQRISEDKINYYFPLTYTVNKEDKLELRGWE
jgi:hypothetical protein